MSKAVELAQKELAVGNEETVEAQFVEQVIVAMHETEEGTYTVETCRTAVIAAPFVKPMPGEPYRATFDRRKEANQYFDRISNRLRGA